MDTDLLLALAGFAFASSITPGPNNLRLMASGANFGFRRTVPHMLGVGIGFVILALAAGSGLAQAFDRWPVLHTALKVCATLYMLWLAWKIATAAPPEGRPADARPLTFLQAAAFQWVNPKAWAMALTAVTVYAPAPGLAGVAAVALIFGAINLPSVSTWTLLGQQMARVLTGRRLRAFNVAMAVLLVLSLWPVLR